MKLKRFLLVLLCLYVVRANAQSISPSSPKVCVGATLTMTVSGTSGGSWVSGNTSIATIGSSTGVATGVAGGTVVINYIYSGGTLTKTLTVNSNPDISGPDATCVDGVNWLIGLTSSFTNYGTPIASGGWSSSNTGIATVTSPSAGTGNVKGIAPGTATITYNLNTGCYSTKVVSVNPLPSISGTYSLCPTASTTLTASSGTGTWSSSNTAVATINSSGVWTAVGGTSDVSANITYTVPGCWVKKAVTVWAAPDPISGTATVCAGSPTTLSDPDGSFGDWSSSDPSIATASAGSVVSGVSYSTVSGVTAGSATISYTFNTGAFHYCWTTKTVIVNPNAGSITGTTTVCVGQTTTLSDPVTGGTWISVTPGVATVGMSDGIVSGVTPGTTLISYSLAGSTGCGYATTVVTVYATPTISGSSSVCEESTITLSASPSGGTWSSDNTTVGPVGSSSGVVTGGTINTSDLSPSSACGISVNITYMSTDGCAATQSVFVNDIAPAITYSPLCVGVLGTPSWDPIGPCGSGTSEWLSSNSSIATVPSDFGYVTGVAEGTATISFTRGNSCYRTAVVTIRPTFSAAITGTTSVCEGGTTDLDCAEPGGTWTSSVPVKASVDASTGVVYGVTSLMANIKPAIVYTVGSACKGVHVTVNTPAITGTASAAVGYTSTLTYPGSESGTWVTSDAGIASISGSGTSCVVTGVSAGTAQISYQFDGSDCRSSIPFTVTCTGCKFGSSQQEQPGLTNMQGWYTLHPNPSDGNITITSSERSDKPLEVKVINYVGATVYGKQLNMSTGESILKLNQLAPGLYIVELKGSNGYSGTQKIVIEK